MTSTDQKEIVLRLLDDRKEIISKINVNSHHSYASVQAAFVRSVQSIDEVIIAWSRPKYAPLQLCPICRGGEQFFPAGKSCSLCNGRKVVAHEIVEPIDETKK